MSARRELLVSGYIREIQAVLLNDKTIPDSIYELCFLFHSLEINILFKKGIGYASDITIGVIDMGTKKTSIIHAKKLDLKDSIQPICHIPNISKGNQTFDAIFGATTELKPYLLLYEPNNNSDITVKYEYISKKSIKCEPQQFLYCNEQNGVIYEHKGKLYQLQLKDIKSDSDLYDAQFKEIKQYKQKFRHKYDDGKLRRVKNVKLEYLNMTYLKNKDSIFGIKCMNGRRCKDRIATITERSVECGMFNINSGKWVDIPSYKYTKSHNDSRFHCLTCCDNNINDNSVYMLTTIADTARYDFSKNKWILLKNKAPKKMEIDWIYANSGILWLEDKNILFCLLGSTGWDSSKCRLYSIDLRVKKKKWISCDKKQKILDGVHKKTNYFFH
eukprot:378847_1